MTRTALFAVVLVAAAVAATAAPPLAFDAQPRYTSMTVSMRAPVANATGATLVISGPESFRVERTFAPGEPLQIDLSKITNPDGTTMRLPDGLYKWELRVVRQSPESAAATVTQPADPAESPAEHYFATGAFRVSFGSITGGMETVRRQNRSAESGSVTARVDQAVVSPGDLSVHALTTNPGGNHFAGAITTDTGLCAYCSDGDGDASWGEVLVKYPNIGAWFSLEDTGTADTMWRLDNSGGNLYFDQYTSSAESFVAEPMTIEAGTPSNTLYLDSAGLVGFGTTTPNNGTTLTMLPVGAWSAGLTIDNSVGTSYAEYVNSVGWFGIGKGGNCALCIAPAAQTDNLLNLIGANVGIRTISPTAPVHVKMAATTDPVLLLDGTNATDSLSLKVRHPNGVVGFGIAGGPGAFFSTAAQHDAVVYGQPGFNLLLGVGGSEWLRITSAGRLGIGGVTAPAHPLQMASGAYVTTGGVWTNASSRTFKQDIAELPADAAVQALSQLNPVTFAYRADPSEKHVGFIAEDAPAILATADRQGLSAMDIVAVLTKVLQEQQKTIGRQQEALAELQARVDQLETK